MTDRCGLTEFGYVAAGAAVLASGGGSWVTRVPFRVFERSTLQTS